jgi:hypothetical protein
MEQIVQAPSRLFRVINRPVFVQKFGTAFAPLLAHEKG